MTIETMKPAHVSQIAALEKRCFSAPWDDRSLASELENPLALWLVAVEGETIVGFADMDGRRWRGTGSWATWALRPCWGSRT